MVVISAVPFSEIAQELSPGSAALPSADHSIPEPLRAPDAVPESFKTLAHVALNEPLAVVSVWLVTFQTKSVQALGEGMSDEEVQSPASALSPVEEGARLLLCSNSRHPDDAAAIANAASINDSFFTMVGPSES